ncbi:hypothetical protein FGO68_gene1256 [Halteria grandinella]|uniref:Uncharacterized protein n=1 Tax=Halteria grandinella TaxID=5974 RepID=A0A8J8T3N4_HALGN|nr:hypothetical protein FGO68_gene1256 [Halteria grandinella]
MLCLFIGSFSNIEAFLINIQTRQLNKIIRHVAFSNWYSKGNRRMIPFRKVIQRAPINRYLIGSFWLSLQSICVYISRMLFKNYLLITWEIPQFSNTFFIPDYEYILSIHPSMRQAS